MKNVNKWYTVYNIFNNFKRNASFTKGHISQLGEIYAAFHVCPRTVTGHIKGSGRLTTEWTGVMSHAWVTTREHKVHLVEKDNAWVKQITSNQPQVPQGVGVGCLMSPQTLKGLCQYSYLVRSRYLVIWLSRWIYLCIGPRLGAEGLNPNIHQLNRLIGLLITRSDRI